MEDFSAKRQALLDSGVKMMDPDTVYVEESVTVGPGTLLLPGTILRGRTVVGANCEIGPKHKAGGLQGGRWRDNKLIPVQ